MAAVAERDCPATGNDCWLHDVREPVGANAQGATLAPTRPFMTQHAVAITTQNGVILGSVLCATTTARSGIEGMDRLPPRPRGDCVPNSLARFQACGLSAPVRRRASMRCRRDAAVRNSSRLLARTTPWLAESESGFNTQEKEIPTSEGSGARATGKLRNQGRRSPASRNTSRVRNLLRQASTAAGWL